MWWGEREWRQCTFFVAWNWITGIASLTSSTRNGLVVLEGGVWRLYGVLVDEVGRRRMRNPFILVCEPQRWVSDSVMVEVERNGVSEFGETMGVVQDISADMTTLVAGRGWTNFCFMFWLISEIIMYFFYNDIYNVCLIWNGQIMTWLPLR